MTRFALSPWIVSTLLSLPLASHGQTLPTVPAGFEIEVVATFDIRPGALSVDDDDNLFVGNFNVVGEDATPIPVIRLTPGGAPEDWGDPIPDPDILVVDREGLVSQPGSILVGGIIAGESGLPGQITEVSADGTRTSVLYQRGCLGNIARMIFDSAGRLLVANFNQENVCVLEGEAVRELIPALDAAEALGAMAVDGEDNIYLTVQGIIQRYDSTGVLTDESFAEGDVIGFGDLGLVGRLIVRREGGLWGIHPRTREAVELVSPTSSAFVAFNSSGDMYLSELNNRRVLRIYLGPISDTDGDGLADFLELQLGLDPGSADSDGDGITDDLEVGDYDLPLDTDHDGTPDYRETDVDGDGLADPDDNCIFVPNADQADSDDDGVGDVCQGDTGDLGGGDSDGESDLSGGGDVDDSSGNQTDDGKASCGCSSMGESRPVLTGLVLLLFVFRRRVRLARR